LLRTEGYDVSVAFDPEHAEQVFRRLGPDLSIVELMVSGGGLALCARLAQMGDGPVLAMSTLDMAAEALAVGASGFLAKPVVPQAFLSAVRDLLGSRSLAERAPANVR
jgi:two-component system response regulator RegX3